MAAGLEPLTRTGASVGTGDVVGPASAVNNRIAVFDGTTGKLLKDGGSTIAEIVAGSGGLVTSVFGRTGAIVAATNDYTWAQIDKTVSSLADLTTRSAGDLNSGTLLAARMPALAGDVTSSAGSVSTTIANNVVTLAKLADIATASFIGRNTAGTGDPEVLSVATAKTMLGISGTNTGDVTLAGENYLSLAGQVITANPVNLGGTNVTGTLTTAKGGTGQASYAVGDLLYASATTTLSRLADVATGNALISGGVGVAPAWGKIGLTTHVTGTLPVTNGGTGTATQFTSGSIVFASGGGVYAQDNAKLFWDDANDRLGVGLATPAQAIHVKGASTTIRVEDASTPNIGEFTVTADFVGIGANRNNVSGVRFDTGKTTASIFMLATAANSAITFGTTPTNNTDPIQRMLIDKDGNVLVGSGSPSQRFEVAGNVFINQATANLYLKDTSTGWQSASSTVVTPQNNNHIRSTNYTSGLIGWNIDAVGNAEFNNVDVRGAIHAALIVYNAIAATAGTLGVFKSAAKLRTDFTVPSGPTYGTTTVQIEVVDPDGLAHASAQVFAVNDILRVKDGLVGDTWFKVSSASDQTTFWRYTCIIMAGSNNVTYRAGLGVADYGLSGQGFIIQTADQTNSPYLQMATHAASFTSLSSGGTLNVTPRLRIGNLNGSYGYAADTYGFGAGQYGTAGQSWLTVDATNGVRIGNNTTVLTQVDTAGNASFTGSITASSGTIAGWTIASNRITSGSTVIASGFDAPAGAMAWFGQSVSSYRGMAIRDASNREIDIISNNATIWPYFAMNDGTRTRVVIGGLNNNWGSDGSTSSMGMKIWSSAGTKLVEFSDAQNMIAGWSINATSMTNSTTIFAAGADPPATQHAWFGTNSFGVQGWQFRDSAGRQLAAIVNNGSIYPFISVYDGARNRVVLGGLNFAFGSDGSTNSMGMKIWDGSGNLLAHFSDVQNTIAGWTITSTKIASTGIDILSGASAGLAFGTTPPTSASAGTGIWLDRTGLYGLASSVVQAKFDAATGRISAGAGEVTLDANGINFNNGTAAANRVKWFDSSRIIGEQWTGKSAGTGTFYNIMAHSVGTGATNNDYITSMSITSDNSNTNGGGTMNLDIIVHGPAHASRPNQQVAYLTWAEGTGSPANRGSFIVGPSLGFTTALTASTALEIRSTTGALLLPRMTSTQRDALTATDGMMLYNTSTNKGQIRAAGAWVDLH